MEQRQRGHRLHNQSQHSYCCQRDRRAVNANKQQWQGEATSLSAQVSTETVRALVLRHPPS